LIEELGHERAIQAIESGDVRALADAGLARGRATRILRRATGGAGMDVLATSDARSAYKELLDLAVDHAVTQRAADRIQVLTPLDSRAAMDDRLDDVLAARDAWAGLADDDRKAVLAAYERYDERAGSEHAAVEAALALLAAGVDSGPFAAIADLERDRLRAAADALAALDGGRVREDADEELDRLWDALGAVEDMDADALALIEDLRSEGVHDVEAFRQAFEDRLLSETDVTIDRVRDAMPTDAADATDFVRGHVAHVADRSHGGGRRAGGNRRERVPGNARGRSRCRRSGGRSGRRHSASPLAGSLRARVRLHSPHFRDGEDAAVSVVNARNLTLAARDGELVQPVTYGLGEHGITSVPDGVNAVPGEQRVAVLTGANSGGKTTLLETLCQIVLLATMGLPVPADRAEVTAVDSLVFHRRHASFNAGVLESTLRSIVPRSRRAVAPSCWSTSSRRSRSRAARRTCSTDWSRSPSTARRLASSSPTSRTTSSRCPASAGRRHLRGGAEPRPRVARRLPAPLWHGGPVDAGVHRLAARRERERPGRTLRVRDAAEAVGNDVVQRTLADARWTAGE